MGATNILTKNPMTKTSLRIFSARINQPVNRLLIFIDPYMIITSNSPLIKCPFFVHPGLLATFGKYYVVLGGLKVLVPKSINYHIYPYNLLPSDLTLNN